MKHADTAKINRVHFSSAGAVRRPRPADQVRPTGIQINWANFIDNLAAIDSPHLIGLNADADDIERRASHAEAVLNVVISYMRALVGDTRYHAACSIDDETGFLANAASDIVGALRQGANRQVEDDTDPAGWMRPYRAETTR
jgi:hypothetical protein